MPTYEFLCQECGTRVEIFDSLSDLVSIGDLRSDSEECPRCLKASTLLRVANTFGVGVMPENEDVYEQVWSDNGDGKTITVEPAARKLKDSHRKVIPKTSPVPKGPHRTG
jgi:putative FmdB family regulatory protein